MDRAKPSLRRWTFDEVERIKVLRRTGRSIEEIATKLGRTPMAINLKVKNLAKMKKTASDRYKDAIARQLRAFEDA